MSGASGALLGTATPPRNVRGYGYNAGFAGDWNGNGVGDVMVSGQGGMENHVFVLDGKTRGRIFQHTATGAFAAGGHDWNGDDFPDFVLLAYVNPVSEIRLFSGAPEGIATLGKRCSAAAPRIGVKGSAHVGEDFLVHLSRVEPGVFAALLLGDLGKPSTFPGHEPSPCSRQVRATTMLATRTSAVTPGHGAATISFPIPNDPALEGTVFHAQWILPARGSAHPASRVLRIEVLPEPQQ